MFKRSLEMRVVKNAKKAESTESDTPEADFEGRAILIGRIFERSIVKIALAVCVYVALDTLRQVAVEMAKK